MDYLLQGISDDGKLYRECRTKKTVRGKSKKGFVDNVIMFDGRYLPVEVKLNINAEKDLPSQCEQYCHVSNLFLTDDVSVPRRETHCEIVLVIDTDRIYLYTSKTKSIDTILSLDGLEQESLPKIKATIAKTIRGRHA